VSQQLSSNRKSCQLFQTHNSLKSVRATAANVLRKLTHRTQTNRRTEPSQSADQSRFLRTSTCKKVVRLLRTLTEEPRKIPSARETMLKEVLVDLVAPLLACAHQALELSEKFTEVDHRIYA
jgi:hypothetical protein